MQFQLESKHTAYTYTIRIREPQENKENQPVYFVLDGSWYYSYIETMVARQCLNSPKTKISDAWIVSIEHGDDIRDRRFNDFTLAAKAYKYPERFKKTPIRAHGGAEKFHAFLKEELMPILDEYHLPSIKYILFGHSLSGLYVVYEAQLADCLFDAGIAFSPSLWWNEHQLFDVKPASKNEMPLFIAVGSEEGFMVEDAKRYHHLGEETTLYIAQDENHASIVPTVMSRAFRHFYEIK